MTPSLIWSHISAISLISILDIVLVVILIYQFLSLVRGTRAAPMLIGCDMTQMDDFTLGLLTNDEVIAVNQDALGQQAKRVASGGEDVEIWARDLQDGTKAVGLFNRGDMPPSVIAKWSALGINGKQTVRDLWRQKDLGEFEGQFSADVGRHGVVLIKVGQPKS